MTNPAHFLLLNLHCKITFKAVLFILNLEYTFGPGFGQYLQLNFVFQKLWNQFRTQIAVHQTAMRLDPFQDKLRQFLNVRIGSIILTLGLICWERMAFLQTN